MGQTAHVLDQDWTAYGLCGREQPDALFVSGAAQRQARLLCGKCPVRVECLVDALDHRVPFGVWGGMTERERRALLRARPEVVSWREVVEVEPDLVAPLVRRGRAVRRLTSAAVSSTTGAATRRRDASTPTGQEREHGAGS